MNAPKKRISLVVFYIALLSLSCSLPTGLGSKIKGFFATQISPTETVENKENPTNEPTVDMEEIATVDESSFQNLTGSVIGNDTSMLDNYRTTFTVISAGKDSSENEINQTIRMESEILNSQSIKHTTMQFEGTGAAADTGKIELYQQDTQMYMVYPENTQLPCLSIGNAGDLLANPYLNQDDFLQSFEIGDLIESHVTINDIVTDHYQIKNSMVKGGDLSFQNAEIWLAVDGGYIVRYTGQAEGNVSDGTNSGSGTIDWDYNLLDIGQVTNITIPEACLNQQETEKDIPIIPNATNQESFGGIITYESPDTPQTVNDFYSEILPAQGWLITNDSNTGGVFMLTAEKDNKNLQIMITPGTSSGSSVIITTIALQ